MDDLTELPSIQSTMSRSRRAQILLRLVDLYGWTLDFITHPDRRGRPARSDPAWQKLMNTPVQFWVCPVGEHRRRTDDRGGPVGTVEWIGDVAHCTAPGCGRASTDRRGGDDGGVAQDQPAPGG